MAPREVQQPQGAIPVSVAPPRDLPAFLQGPSVYVIAQQPTATYVWFPCQVWQQPGHPTGTPQPAVQPTAIVGNFAGGALSPVSEATAEGVDLLANHAGAAAGVDMGHRDANWSHRQRGWQSTCDHELAHDADAFDGDDDDCDGCVASCPLPMQAFEPGMKKRDSVEEASVSGSICSTAPSLQRRRQKQRSRPNQRQAAAQRHREGMEQAKSILERKARYTQQLQSGGRARATALEELQSAIWHLSTDADGCRLVQLALDLAQGHDRARLVKGLHGHVREAMGSPHANYVIQKVVTAMPLELACFVAEELSGISSEACRHRYGCRIMSRLIEQFGASTHVTSLVDEMMEEISSLLQHSFGRFVVQAVLEHGSASHRHIIADRLATEILANATSRQGSYVIETALRNCSVNDVATLAARAAEEDVVAMSQDPYAIFVLRSLMDLPGDVAGNIARQLAMAPSAVKANKNYQRLQEFLKDGDRDKQDRESC